MTQAFTDLPASWMPHLGAELEKPYFRKLQSFVAAEREQHQVFPPPEQVFAALEHTPYERVRVLLLGQDPYHDDGQAHGLCFSVGRGLALPPSLKNIYKELEADLGIAPPSHGSLLDWADRGVLMLNTVLTVRAHEPNSHQKKGWETFTDKVIEVLAARPEPVVFVLWVHEPGAKAILEHAAAFEQLVALNLAENFIPAALCEQLQARFGHVVECSGQREPDIEDGQAHYYASVGE